VGFLVALIVGIIAIKVIPVMVAVGEFDKEVKAQADRASLPAHNDKYIRKQLLLEAEELDIPINAKSIWIKRTGSRIKIRVTYDKAIDFPGYTYVWHKEHYEDRPLF
jgi:predicted GNAT superfamily acetyltransferase